MLTQKRLKKLLNYNSKTGIFTRKVSVAYNAQRGDIVGCPNERGYLLCRIDGKGYRLHRLAFLYMEGFFPEFGVDHENGIVDDNKWDNLKHATQGCNLQNTKKRSTNTSGFPGVRFHKQNRNWIVRPQLNGKYITVGSYSTKLNAALARLTWEVNCEQWNCNHRGELVKAIKAAWPEFNEKCLS